MEAAVREAVRNPDPIQAALRFAQLLEKLTPDNARAVLYSLHANASGEAGTLFVGLLAHPWGALDGPAAVAGKQSLNKRNMDGAAGAAMAARAARDHEKERGDVQVEIARRWQAPSPPDAKTWITAHLPVEAQKRAMTPGR